MFKCFYKDFHSNYCFSPFILSPSLSISLRPIHTSAKSSAPNWMPNLCLPTATTLHFLPAPPSLPSPLPHHSIPVFFMPPSPGPTSTFTFCKIFLWLIANLPVTCLHPLALIWPCNHSIPSKYTTVSKYMLTSKRVQPGVSFNQSCACLRRLRLVSHTQSSKIQISEKFCLRLQAPHPC